MVAKPIAIAIAIAERLDCFEHRHLTGQLGSFAVRMVVQQLSQDGTREA